MKIPRIDPALLLTIAFGEVGAYTLIPQPEQVHNESKCAIAEAEENAEVIERKKARKLCNFQ